MSGRKTRLIVFLVAGLALVGLVAGAAVSRQARSRTVHAASQPPVPVTVTVAAKRDVPIYFDALGTVQASNTVAIRAQVSGQLVSIDFRQGQEVGQGDVLARIDPAPFKAALDQAVAKRQQDEAQLADAEKNLGRFKTLLARNAETQQNVDTQQSKVDTLRATIEADRAAIEAAQTQLNYATITAPIGGIVGFRQLDVGNIIHPTDPGPLTVLTQIKPCVTVFTLPQESLGPVREAMLRGAVEVLAYDQDRAKQLGKGRLLLIDNQIDQTTSTIRLKAEFANEDERLWPGEFIHVRLLAATRQNAVTIPPLSLQRGPDGLYVWVVRPDHTVEQRPVQAQTVSDTATIVSKGLSAGEQIVLEGQSRLEDGARINIRSASNAEPESVRVE